ncbi:hypothetical protein CVT24_007392 [Panaeolus cyanescens]|uniref:NAD(P)-binding protein n=1 Tax=Panaeolus cyanescens TaxID=181874 RepID=A0A409YKX4_9AGAR|nr:hypothetical protein CVT24_007392 [Panaeolus cyanescens]
MSWFSRRTISEDDLIDLHGKVAIVTGGNAGVGYATVQFLVRKGAKVYLAARNESRALAAIEKLKADGIENGDLQWLYLDLADPRLAKKSAEDFLTKEKRLDILGAPLKPFNNAALTAMGPFALDKDGLLNITVTNHISHYVFTRTLLPLLKQTAAQPHSDVRIVNVTSTAHSKVHPATLKGRENININYGEGVRLSLQTYGLTKLANILHITELQRSFDASSSPESNITCLAVHPGTLKTATTDTFLASIPYVSPIAQLLGGLIFIDPKYGGINVAWAAAGKEIAASRSDYRGKYITPVATVSTPSAAAQDERLARELRETTEEILQDLGFEDDLVDLHGKVAIVTGANTGIGYATAQFLVRKGAKVYIAARNESRALDAIQKMQVEGIEDGTLRWLHLDLSDPRLAKKSAEEFASKENRLDILVNNAAIAAVGPYKVDKDGLLDIVVTNHISHYVFTRTLLPLLKQTASEPNSDVRIVNVSSVAHTEVHPKSFKTKEEVTKDYGQGFYKYVQTYGLTKLQNILHIAELQRQLNASASEGRITCMAAHPGYIHTRGSGDFLAGVPLGSIIKPLLTSTLFVSWRDGAMNVVWAAAGKEVAQDREKYAGKYLEPMGKIMSGSAEARDEGLAKELWATTEQILKEMGL